MRRILTLGISLIAIQTAQAQSDHRQCAGLGTDAGAEKQAVCWFEKEQSGAEECTTDKEGVSACTLQTAAWCDKAVFDDPSVVNACFLAHIRARQFEEALSMERYLQNPTPEAANCRHALEVIAVKFVSVPAGAELLVDGHSYGKAPVEVELRGQWWTRKPVARFGTGKGAKTVEVSRQDLIAAFDRNACVMAEVAVNGPETAPSAPWAQQTPQSSAATASTETPTDARTKVSVPAVISITVGGAGVITGAVLLAIARSQASDLQSPRTGTPWNQDLLDKDKSVKSLSAGGWVALSVGAALLTAGVVLIAIAEGSSPESASSGVSQTLQLADQTIQWTGRF